MINVYLYVLDTLADWEVGLITAELNSMRFFKKDAKSISLKTVSVSKEPIKSMGGLTIVPDCTVDDIVINETSVLILPGANTWNDPKHGEILKVAKEILDVGATLCAICGATTALAGLGILDERAHTSNGPGFLEMFCHEYKGTSCYVDMPSVSDNNLITASATGSLMWTKLIIEHLDVFNPDTLEAWYDYFCTGKAESFYALMQTLPINK